MFPAISHLTLKDFSQDVREVMSKMIKQELDNQKVLRAVKSKTDEMESLTKELTEKISQTVVPTL